MDIFFTDNELVEYIFGTLGLIIGFIISFKMPLSYEIIIRWSIMWTLRKLFLNLYISIKDKYNILSRKFIIFPYPKIIL